jgi:hypothetical protein
MPSHLFLAELDDPVEMLRSWPPDHVGEGGSTTLTWQSRTQKA